MSVNARVAAYLDDQHIPYKVIPHEHSFSSFSSAMTAEIELSKMAKAVLLQDHEGRYMMAVLPANNKVSLHKLNDQFNRSFHLAKEDQVYHLFSDCAPGAIPPVAKAFHMDCVVDEKLDACSEVFMEAGDHDNLIQFNHDAFIKMTSDNRHDRFAAEVVYAF